MQAYRKDFPVPELAEGALPKPFNYTVANASGSESSVLFPCLIFCFVLFPFIFREIPCSSVANLSLLLFLPSVSLPLYFP